MAWVHYCVYCGEHRDAAGSTMLEPTCGSCGCPVRSCLAAEFEAISAQEIGQPPAQAERRDAGAWFGVFVLVAFGVPLSGIALADLVFAVPAVLSAFAAQRALAAARTDAPRAGAWRTLALAAALATVSTALTVVGDLAGVGLEIALCAGVAASVALLGGMLRMAAACLPGIRLDGLLDALLASVVVAALAVRGVVIPGVRDGDLLLTGVFCIGLVGLALAGTIALAAPSAASRRLGRPLAYCAIAGAAVTGIVASAASGKIGPEPWLVALVSAATMWWLAAAAIKALELTGDEEPASEPTGWRWFATRVVGPFVAASALPVTGFGRAAMPGMLAPWEFAYFGSLSLLVLALAFTRQAHLLLVNGKAVRRERALREHSQRRNEELEALTGLATTMTQTLEETPIVEQSLEVLHLAARASSSALYLNRAGGYHLAATAGAWQGEHPWTRPVETGVPAPEFRGDRHITRLPLAARGHSIGTVVFLRPATEPLTGDALDLLRLLVDQLAVAIQNARDYRDRLEQAIRDPLTGLYNRRFFFEALEKEVRRCERYGASASLVLFDVDDFKTVNDKCGHCAGDEVLRRIAAIVGPLLRPSDSFARIGGEEFALLLPETQQLDALLVADRLRTAIARTRIIDGRRITVSGGVASCPGDARTREELLRRADAALYWAKCNGKDLCAVAGDAARDSEGWGEELTRGAHLYGLVASIDGQTRYTRDHSENVAAYASALGRALGLERMRMGALRRAALLHDIGKVAVPVGILSKPGRLTEREFAEIQRHSTVGATMILRAGLQEEAKFVRHHHERFDGAGYPDRIAGEEIPFESRILFVADSFEAMTSDRAYRRGMSPDEAVAELRRCAGTQFDPTVVEALVELLERGELPVAALRT